MVTGTRGWKASVAALLCLVPMFATHFQIAIDTKGIITGFGVTPAQ